MVLSIFKIVNLFITFKLTHTTNFSIVFSHKYYIGIE